MLSLGLFIILSNYLESLWMRGFEFLWVVFLIIAAEAARYWQFPADKSGVRVEASKTAQPWPLTSRAEAFSEHSDLKLTEISDLEADTVSKWITATACGDSG